ncbi:hypothetical protein GOP47_0010329 [Adiantum capillus-veneris]|uniref:Uncharacterized protein n=1 Tax=Adiantum capillus-veneris TaxID=13818 RepID=A0A9D4UUI4_ADICA|nr:hypothetical protein GOP47_0010329 [Adiantum capillus-veneris]
MTAVASAGMLRHCKHNELYRGCWSCRFHIKDLCLGNLHPCGPLCGSLNTKHQARTLDSRSCWLHYQRPHSGWQAVPGYYRTIRENPDLSVGCRQNVPKTFFLRTVRSRSPILVLYRRWLS